MYKDKFKNAVNNYGKSSKVVVVAAPVRSVTLLARSTWLGF